MARTHRPHQPPWPLDLTAWDLVCQLHLGRFYRPQHFYAWVLDRGRTLCRQLAVLAQLLIRREQVISEFVYIELGRPRWFVERSVAKQLMDGTAAINPPLWPHDAFTLVFQPGLVVAGRELRWLRAARLNSELARFEARQVARRIPAPGTAVYTAAWADQNTMTTVLPHGQTGHPLAATIRGLALRAMGYAARNPARLEIRRDIWEEREEYPGRRDYQKRLCAE